jgi:flavin reductase (DIM6/NTAB) family NADH-FMN oxidoreductase RutF
LSNKNVKLSTEINTELDMDNEFSLIKSEVLSENLFKLIGEDWMLITAGTQDNFNTMTASWGTMGILWNKPVAICYIRPQRYTLDFVEKSDYYTLSFFNEKYRDILNFCGTKSGRDYDKMKETGLRPMLTQNGNIGYEECRLFLECRKLYAGNIEENGFIDTILRKKIYPGTDYHRFFIGEITSVWKK